MPVKHLGFPLILGKVCDKECKPWVDVVTLRMKTWTVSHLSYAGRFQLVEAIIFSIINFQSQAVIFPKKVIKMFEQKCGVFLWKGGPDAAKGAKVAWDDVCMTVSECGLGLRKLVIWNIARALNLWRLLLKSGSIWVAWTRSYLLMDESIWIVQARGESTSVWRKLLRSFLMSQIKI